MPTASRPLPTDSHPSYVELPIGDRRLRLKDTPSNRKALVVIGRCCVDESGEPVLSFQEISESLGHPARQWSHNIYREYQRGYALAASTAQPSSSIGFGPDS